MSAVRSRLRSSDFCDAAVVQLVRISACHNKSKGIKTRPLRHLKIEMLDPLRALSSVGRASALQAECRRFDPVSAHHLLFI